ncbi:MAG TPA: hypothetical protein VFY12_10215 [Arenimonas sp.]|nr:hypothetical protein [Arenimonas sp.]
MSRQGLQDRLRQALAENPRLRLAIPLLGLLATLFAWQELDAVRGDAAKAAQAEQAKLARIKALRGQDFWLERADESQRIRDALLAEMPLTATPGLAQASVQSQLTALSRALGGRSNARITAEPVLDDTLPEGIVRIRGSLSAGMAPRQALDILQRIESAANLNVIERSDIRSGSNQTASIVFSAYFRLQADGVEE